MSFNGESHTSDGHATAAYCKWCEEIYTRCGTFDSPAMKEAKHKLALREAYAQLAKLTVITKNHLFLTINPPPEIDICKFQTYIKRIVNKKWIIKYLLCYEQRGENDETKGRGFHVHILIEHNPMKPSHIKRELANTLKDIMDVENYHILNIKHIDSTEAKRKINYIIGTKKEAEKHTKQHYDIIWRKEMNLDPYYNMNYIIEDAIQKSTSQI